jgi:hypothetical protein
VPVAVEDLNTVLGRVRGQLQQAYAPQRQAYQAEIPQLRQNLQANLGQLASEKGLETTRLNQQQESQKGTIAARNAAVGLGGSGVQTSQEQDLLKQINDAFTALSTKYGGLELQARQGEQQQEQDITQRIAGLTGTIESEAQREAGATVKGEQQFAMQEARLEEQARRDNAQMANIASLISKRDAPKELSPTEQSAANKETAKQYVAMDARQGGLLKDIMGKYQQYGLTPEEILSLYDASSTYGHHTEGAQDLNQKYGIKIAQDKSGNWYYPGK